MSPRHLLRAALSPPDPPDLTGETLGRYEMRRKLGQGGMGMVYEAYDPLLKRVVALKILTQELDARARLLQEAQITAGLKHEHIVRVYEVGEHDGIAYFTMDHIDGGRLVTPAVDVRAAAAVMREVARAVGHANSHGILHRDLKPQNILIDGAGQPFVTDFGIASRHGPGAGAALVAGGTPMYVAPEVRSGEPSATSIAADVWGLGAILYALLPGLPPVEGMTAPAPGPEVGGQPPPRVPRDLAAICLHCLETDPAARYGTATEVAADLDRYLAGQETAARPWPPAERARRFAGRHPLAAALGALLILAAAYVVVTALLLARAQQIALHAADFAARSAANLTAERVERLAALVESGGREPQVARALGSAPDRDPTAVCTELYARHRAHPFESWWLFDQDGVMRGRWPMALRDNRGKSYAFRDYFQGAARLAQERRPGVHVSRAFRSEDDHSHTVALAVPIHDADGRWVGVLAVSLPTGSAFGAVPLEDGGGDQLTAAVIAPRDRERADGEGEPHEPIFILHPTLGRGQALPAPTGGGPDTRSLMHVAPVRGTPFSVLVRFAYDGSIATRLGRLEILIAWLPAVTALALAAALLRRARRRAARARPVGR